MQIKYKMRQLSENLKLSLVTVVTLTDFVNICSTHNKLVALMIIMRLAVRML